MENTNNSKKGKSKKEHFAHLVWPPYPDYADDDEPYHDPYDEDSRPH